MDQFKRAKDAFPKRKYKFILITPKGVQRISQDKFDKYFNLGKYKV